MKELADALAGKLGLNKTEVWASETIGSAFQHMRPETATLLAFNLLVSIARRQGLSFTDTAVRLEKAWAAAESVEAVKL